MGSFDLNKCVKAVVGVAIKISPRDFGELVVDNMLDNPNVAAIGNATLRAGQRFEGVKDYEDAKRIISGMIKDDSLIIDSSVDKKHLDHIIHYHLSNSAYNTILSEAMLKSDRESKSLKDTLLEMIDLPECK